MKSIIEISDIKGLVTALSILACLAAGFVAFPGFLAMSIWNKLIGLYPLNLLQGIMLWTIIVLGYCTITKKKFSISFAQPQELNDEEINEIMKRIRHARALQKTALKQNKTKSDEVKNEENFSNHI